MNILVNEKFHERRLIDVLFSALEWSSSKRKLKLAIEKGLCFVNGKSERFASSIVKQGDSIRFEGQWVEKVTHKTEKPTLIYEDDYFIACDKPSGVCSETELPGYLNKGDLHLIHRLDKGTTGVMLLAKTKEASERFTNLFRQRTIKKIYQALCCGVPSKKQGMIENCLGKVGSYSGQTVWGAVPEGKKAITKWYVLESYEGYSLIQCEPFTGRTHQIRVHLAQMNCPVLGDFQYCRTQKHSFFLSRPLLHAKSLSFIHPYTKEELYFKVEPPLDFKSILNELK